MCSGSWCQRVASIGTWFSAGRMRECGSCSQFSTFSMSMALVIARVRTDLGLWAFPITRIPKAKSHQIWRYLGHMQLHDDDNESSKPYQSCWSWQLYNMMITWWHFSISADCLPCIHQDNHLESSLTTPPHESVPINATPTVNFPSIPANSIDQELNPLYPTPILFHCDQTTVLWQQCHQRHQQSHLIYRGNPHALKTHALKWPHICSISRLLENLSISPYNSLFIVFATINPSFGNTLPK